MAQTAAGQPSIKPYDWLAPYYDELFTYFRMPLEAAREHKLRRILPRVKTACDLACGTGTTAVSLAQRGIKTYAVDLSAAMCRITREKAAQTQLPLEVVQADMRTFRLPERVSLITCEFDALNHLPCRTDLRLVAQSVARALLPGGHFFFDVNTAFGFKRYWSNTNWFEKPGLAVVMRSAHSPEADRAWCDIESFVQDGVYWRRQHERLEEVAWTAPEVRQAFEDAGFDQLRAWDAAPYFKQSAPIARGSRTIYLAAKPHK